MKTCSRAASTCGSLLACAVLAYFQLQAPGAIADSYRTYVNESGQVVVEAVGQLEDASEAEVADTPSEPSSTDSNLVESYRTFTGADGRVQVERIAPPQRANSGQLEPGMERGEETDAPSDSAGRTRPVWEDFDEEDFIDASVLQEQGFVRDGQQRFYTWIDEQGTFHSSPIGRSRSAAPSVVESGQSARIVAREEWLPAYTEVEREQGVAIESEGDGAGSGAFLDSTQVINTSGSAVDPSQASLSDEAQELPDILRIASVCCEHLRETPVYSLHWDDTLLVEMTAREERAEFGVGLSNYHVVHLPEATAADVPRIFAIASYVRGKVYAPAVLTLDANFRPVRLLTDILYAWREKTWFSHASLTGYFAVASGSRERYMVVFSLERDLLASTVVQPEEGSPVVLPHDIAGELHLRWVNPVE